MNETDRVHAYERQNDGRPLTPAQLRRIKHKRGRDLYAFTKAELRYRHRPRTTINLPVGATRLWFTPDGGSSVELTSMVREIRVGTSGLQTKIPISARNLRRLIAKGKLDHER